jgi:ATP adenylyltransferase
MAYVGGSDRVPGCVFCNLAQSDDDRASLILHRGEHCFVVMNLYPYSTGHAMIVPFQHVANPEDLPTATLHEMAELLPRCVATARRTLGCAGFNVGMNLGNVAGAGVADHLHEHIVPRWVGDANFMPILSSTTVMPELLPATYAKLRAEFERDRSDSIGAVVLDSGARRVLIERDGRNVGFPRALLNPEAPAWRQAVDGLRERGVHASVIDWAGAPSTRSPEPAALLMRSATERGTDSMTWTEIAALSSLPLTSADRLIADRLDVPALVEG